MRHTTLTGIVLLILATHAHGAIVIISTGTMGHYNSSLGNTLDNTSALFPVSPDDPTIDPAPEPDLSPVAGLLGDWLGDPGSLNGNWSGLQFIPTGWPVSTENAIIYPFDAGAGLTNIQIGIGVDNGAFVWLDGVYLGGHIRPGGVVANELSLSGGTVGPGIHYLQVLREDHGSTDGYSISVAADPIPEPASLSLLSLGGLISFRRRQ